MYFCNMVSENQLLDLELPNQITLTIKREDQLHPLVSGNKYRKLKYNIQEALALQKNKVLTFGGAYSNHIVATAAAAQLSGLTSVGVIRGEELASKISDNHTLSLAQSLGMQFDFVTREVYRDKESEAFHSQLHQKWGDFYLIPEGGTNALAIKGCEEILMYQDSQYDYICCSVGTGGTISGLINSSSEHQKIIGFSSLKTMYLQDEITKFAKQTNWNLDTTYHFGGYAKTTDELIAFINEFYKQTRVPLDPVYTGKMMFGIFDKIKKGFFKENSKILAIHTGGLQGIQGMNAVLQKRNKKIVITSNQINE